MDEGVRRAKEEYEKQLGSEGRILVRPSGTEPVIRVMVEGSDEAFIRQVADGLAQTIVERLGYNEDYKGLETI